MRVKITDCSFAKIEIIFKKCSKMSTMHLGSFNYSGYHLGHENVHPSPIRLLILSVFIDQPIWTRNNLQFTHWRYIDEYIRVFWDLIFKWEPDQKLLT